VPLKSAEQQAQLIQHRTRDHLMRQRTQLINAIRAHMAELGIAAPQGREGVKQLLTIIADGGDKHLPAEDNSVRKTPILRRILNFLSAWDRKQRDRETARLIARSGGCFTDELERRISDWFLSGGGIDEH
jgi:transposase